MIKHQLWDYLSLHSTDSGCFSISILQVGQTQVSRWPGCLVRVALRLAVVWGGCLTLSKQTALLLGSREGGVPGLAA